MIVEPATVLVASVAYLAVLFTVAEIAERWPWVRQKLVPHPLVYALSLCVYATTWTFYGSVGYAQDHGYTYAAIGLGVALSSLLIPLVWQRVLQLVQGRRLSSVADVFAYHYRSQSLGVVVTLLLVCGSLPYLALQFRAVTSSLAAISGRSYPSIVVGAIYLAVVTAFALLFGIRHDVSQRQHPGLIVAVALESLVKLVAVVTVLVVAVQGVFGGLGELDAWIEANPEVLVQLYEPVVHQPWATMLLLATSAAFLLPRQFHMAFVECSGERALNGAIWLVPALMLVFYGGTPILLWAGAVVSPEGNPDLHVLAVASRWPAVALLTFIGGLSASSAMIIVTALALSAMLLNHVALPLRPAGGDLYQGLRWARRVLVAGVTSAGFLVFAALDYRGGLVELGLTSFVGVAQLLPGLAGVLFWPRATRRGIFIGLLAGSATWAALLLPTLFFPSWDIAEQIVPGLPGWAVATYASLGLNAALAVGVSLVLSEPSVLRPSGIPAPAAGVSVGVLTERLSPLLGADAAAAELARALHQLGLSPEASSDAELQRLSGRVERNLTGLVGPLMANTLVRAGRSPSHPSELAELVSSIRAPAAPLAPQDASLALVRRTLERVVDELPLAVGAADSAGRVAVWNQRLFQLTGLSSDATLGVELERIAAPWGALLANATRSQKGPIEQEVSVDGKSHVVSVGCCEAGTAQDRLFVLTVEDLTEYRQLDAQLAHQDRLASLGRLSAGVAHEIGNPLTGLLMVAQNLRREASETDVCQRLDLIVKEGRRIKDILESLKDFSRSGVDALAEHPNLQPAPVLEVCKEALELVRLSGQAWGVELSATAPEDLTMDCDPRRIAQVLTNLIDNATRASLFAATATGRNPRVEVRARLAGQFVEIDVADSGSGIPAEYSTRIFEPFFTRRTEGTGTGLGLAVALSIAQQHCGTLRVESTGAAGTCMRLSLPWRQQRATESDGAT